MTLVRSAATRVWKTLLWSLRLPTKEHALGWWLATRCMVLLAWVVVGFSTHGDVLYYHWHIDQLFHGTPAQDILKEYPTPLVWILSIPYILGFGTPSGYLFIFLALFLLGDGLMGYTLWRSARWCGTNPRPAVIFWIWFVVALGPIIYTRLDFLTTAVATMGLIALVRSRPATSGAIMALGTSLKLWPALLWPATAINRRAVSRTVLGFCTVGLGLVILSVVFAGWERLISPLTWQSERGLHMESVFATPGMLARLFDTGPGEQWSVYLSTFNAWEITGPGSAILTTCSSAAFITGTLLIVTLYAGWLTHRSRTTMEAVILVIVAIAIIIVTNKTFSPQYIIWISGPIAMALLIAHQPSKETCTASRLPSPDQILHSRQHIHGRESSHLTQQLARGTIIMAVLTQLIYPVLYRHYIISSAMTPVAIGILTIRNLSITVGTIALAIYCWRNISFQSKSAGSMHS
ncbi:MAG: DUF2029 domain-containing protein [Propionibacteriaceae bacterium]|nr:DUF2029 domain-containing protein [Propionibacteriaceae bacterium]